MPVPSGILRMDKPTISVIMPVLNRGDMIEKAIYSVLAQQYPNVELIILMAVQLIIRLK